MSPKPPGSAVGTWKGLGGFWSQHDNEPDKADYYFRQLVWYDEELQKDDYVVGATIFTWGSYDKPWADFDVAGTQVAKKLIAYTQQDPAKSFKYPKFDDGGDNGDEGGEDVDEDDVAVDERPRGLPRTQYKRTYVLLPPQADTAWARAVIEATWDSKRYTVGSSADDAGIGDLDGRHVLAVNPHEWAGAQSLEDFFKKYYPGVKYRAITAATPAELVQKLK